MTTAASARSSLEWRMPTPMPSTRTRSALSASIAVSRWRGAAATPTAAIKTPPSVKYDALTSPPRNGESQGGRLPIPSRRGRVLVPADLPDHAGAGNLHQRSVGGVLEPGIGVGSSEIPDRAIIGNIGATIVPKPDVRGAVEAGNPTDEGLLKGLVVGKTLEVQGQRFSSAALIVERVPRLPEIHQLHFVPGLGRRRGGVRRIEPEIAF